MVRIPTQDIWSSRDISVCLVQLAFKRPSLKCVEFEPARRRTLSHYEKELSELEEQLLADINIERKLSEKDDSILAGHNTDGKGNVIVFKQRDNVRTQSTQVPKNLVVHTNSTDHLMRILKSEDAMRNFTFTPGTISSEILLEGEAPTDIGVKIANLKREPHEERTIRELPEDEESRTPTSVSESDVFSGSSSIKAEPSTPANSCSPSDLHDTQIRGLKRGRVSDSSSSKDTVNTNSDLDDDSDWTDPDNAIKLFQRMKGSPNLRINYATATALKRLNQAHFNERAKRKPSAQRKDDNLKRKLKNISKAGEKLKDLSKKKTDGEKMKKPQVKRHKVHIFNCEPKIKGKELLNDSPNDDFEQMLDVFEEEITEKKKADSPKDNVIAKKPAEKDVPDDLDYKGPEITFPDGETNGKDGIMIMNSLSGVISRDPTGPGPKSLRRAEFQIVVYCFTGKTRLNQLTMMILNKFYQFTVTNTTFSRIHHRSSLVNWVRNAPGVYSE